MWVGLEIKKAVKNAEKAKNFVENFNFFWRLTSFQWIINDLISLKIMDYNNGL